MFFHPVFRHGFAFQYFAESQHLIKQRVNDSDLIQEELYMQRLNIFDLRKRWNFPCQENEREKTFVQKY